MKRGSAPASATPSDHVVIAGAGPTGLLLALFLRRRGIQVTVYERRADPRSAAPERGRSINLALAERGIHALKCAGIFGALEGALLPMRGRMIHAVDGSESLQLYGREPHEVIYSISRARLSELLLRAAEAAGAQVHFQKAIRVDFAAASRVWTEGHSTGQQWIDERPVIAADGAGSHLRDALAASAHSRVRIEHLAHAYKELTIPAATAGQAALALDALHIWPRGGFMLIALPNPDASFTATLFLEQQRFDALQSSASVLQFWSTYFPDTLALIPDLTEQFATHPTSGLTTVYAEGWHAADQLLLIGDAAHAIVPFHGQGMNACFEDCVHLDAAADAHSTWQAAFTAFERDRKPDTDAIARMALENYREMREQVADVHFQFQSQVAHELAARFPQRFVPRYSMVTFSHTIGYAQAEQRGQIQQSILDSLTARTSGLERIDWNRAREEIVARLPVL